jgi:hypothetical protein
MQFYAPSAHAPVLNQSWVVADTNGNGLNDVNAFFYNNVSGHTGEDIIPDNTATDVTTVTPPDYWSSTCGCNVALVVGLRAIGQP